MVTMNNTKFFLLWVVLLTTPFAYEQCVQYGKCLVNDEIYEIGKVQLPNPAHQFLIQHAAIRVGFQQIGPLIRPPAYFDLEMAKKGLPILKDIARMIELRAQMHNNVFYVKANEVIPGIAEGAEFLNDQNLVALREMVEMVETAIDGYENKEGNYEAAWNKLKDYIIGFTRMIDLEEKEIFPKIKDAFPFAESTVFTRFSLHKYKKEIAEFVVPFVLSRVDPFVGRYFAVIIQNGVPKEKIFVKTFLPTILRYLPPEHRPELIKELKLATDVNIDDLVSRKPGHSQEIDPDGKLADLLPKGKLAEFAKGSQGKKSGHVDELQKADL